MVAVGIGLLWAAYVLTLYGYTKVHQMPISIQDLVIPGHYDACQWSNAIAIGKDTKATTC